MKRSRLLGAVCAVLFTFISMSASAALISRLGGLAYYDTLLDITWAADANINSGANWDDQVAWVTGLDIGGVTGWRLPDMNVNGDGVVDCSSVLIDEMACRGNEYGHLFNYGAGTVLGGGITGSSSSPFSNLQGATGAHYWSGTESGNQLSAWQFVFFDGVQGLTGKSGGFFAWAVLDGDISAVPVPAAAWLFGSGLLGLVGMARRKKAA